LALSPGGRGPPFFSGPRSARPAGAALQEEVTVIGLLIPLTAASNSSSGSSASLIIFLVLIVGSFYFLLIRPQQRRARQQRSLIGSVDIGDEVMTIGGIYGTVKAIDDESFTLEVAPGVDLRFVKTSIARKLVYEEFDEDDEEDEGDHEDHHEEEADDQA
jgi:preprotein translocase subunit YajC